MLAILYFCVNDISTSITMGTRERYNQQSKIKFVSHTAIWSSPLHACFPIDLSSTVNSILDHRPLNTLLQTNTSNNAVIMDEIFSITCTTEANPPAKYVIYRDETRIVGNNSDVTSSVSERVKRVTFTCKPSNFYGVGQMAGVSLDVLCKWNCCDSVWYAFTFMCVIACDIILNGV